MSSTTNTVRALLVVQAILIGIIFALCAGVLAAHAGVTLAASIAVAGGAFLTAVPVALGVQRAIMG